MGADRVEMELNFVRRQCVTLRWFAGGGALRRLDEQREQR
jgi:hypothetical protein